MTATSPLIELLGRDETAARVRSSIAGEVAVVAAATVADLAVLGVKADGGLYAERAFEPGEAAADHRRQLDALAGLVAGDDRIDLVRTPDDITASIDDGPSVFVTCEGGDFLERRVGDLADAYAMGARSVTLVHYRVNELGDIQTEAPIHGGLTGFGVEVIAEMNRLGMIVDLAHATFEATTQALDASTAPIMISHSHLAGPGADHPRLLSEEHARMVAEAGGLIGAWPAGIVMESLDDYCDEICRMIEVVGLEHVAIGTDLDANYRPVLTDYEQFPDVAAGLRRRGMVASEVDQVLGGNFVTLFESVTAAGDQERRGAQRRAAKGFRG